MRPYAMTLNDSPANFTLHRSPRKLQVKRYSSFSVGERRAVLVFVHATPSASIQKDISKLRITSQNPVSDIILYTVNRFTGSIEKLNCKLELNGVFTPEQDNDKTNVEVHSYDAFHTRFVGPGVKGIIGMHRFNICLVVVLSLSCSGVKTP